MAKRPSKQDPWTPDLREHLRSMGWRFVRYPHEIHDDWKVYPPGNPDFMSSIWLTTSDPEQLPLYLASPEACINACPRTGFEAHWYPGYSLPLLEALLSYHTKGTAS